MRKTQLQPVGRFYLVEVSGREGSYFVETNTLTRGKDMSAKDGLAFLQQQDDALQVFECIPNEGYMRNVSEDMARAWLDQFDGERDDLPAFIALHLSDDDLDEHYHELDMDREYRRELSSPYLTGRV